MPDRRLRIAFVVDRFGSRFGGAEAYGVELMRELSSRHEITVLARDYDDACDLRLPYVPLRSWKHWPSWVRVLLFALRARRRTRSGFDIVHSHMNGWCGDVEVIHVTPVRYNWRVRPLPWLKRALSRISFRVQTYLHLEQRRVAPRSGHRTVAVSGLIAEQLRQAYPVLSVLPIIPPGVAPAVQGPQGERVATRQALGYADDDLVCLLVARNPLRKGLPTMLAALDQLPQSVKLLIVGGNAAAREHVAQRNADDLMSRVRILGETPHVAQYYQAADVYVHPTLNDSFGMAPLEAMSFGLPVVLSPAPWCGFAQYVKEGSEALVLNHPEDAGQLAAFIQRLYSEPALRQRLAGGGAQVVARHSWPRVAGQFEALYQEVLAERPAA
ncbi:glycosyltransferase family 4 protein [Pusillimonas noertemannii]|uniref:UDP-glucose:(Heptosyl)LPS alpha-1,3-glucosyltransferase n=1 Tax=Pusillimonas noertemannii TaxID=305977 RepID=A0A2U1CI26_9BURK|nr:glycosyltransferase family 4 protein [Pusillimonas noertemannii]NYT69553.1 glycosyltransferase family 4 protein [Pusillimonas noertemannii]PVY60587.1 UDP-glucose:(heptosyl)LPS alpha-1,3-glucosyltransferase [Pusillimonas noertemannii]TFL09934.1 glycosyltransferase family 1 protein [Pusillimonas noertemannii]